MNPVPIVIVTAIFAPCVVGCVTKPVEVPDEPFKVYGPIDPKVRQLGVGEYSALDFGNLWVVTARGVDSSTSWRHELVREGKRDGAAVVTHYVEQPLAAGAAMTPFVVSRVVSPHTRKAVFVRDREGLHEVPVRAPPEAPGSKGKN